jgi:hypothetical protein
MAIPFCHHAVGMIESTNRFSFTSAASTSGRGAREQAQQMEGISYE